MDDLTIKAGITNEQIDQLVAFANNDPSVRDLTSDYRRFKTREMADRWFKDTQPIVFTLVNEKNELRGVIWFTVYPIPKTEYNIKFDPEKYPFTFAIRLYEDARGKGLAVDFFNNCYEKFKQTDYYKKQTHNGLWLGTYPLNIPAINLYKKLGFVQVNDPKELNRVLMILK